MTKWCVILDNGDVYYFYDKYFNDIVIKLYETSSLFSTTLTPREFEILAKSANHDRSGIDYLVSLYNRCVTEKEITDVMAVAELFYTGQEDIPFD